MGRGQVPYDAALPAADLVELPVDQQQQVIGGYVLAPLVDDGNSVRVAISGHTQVVVALVADACDEHLQGLEIRSWRAAAKQRVVALVDEGDPAAGVREDRAEGQLRGAVHRVDDDLEPGRADGLNVDELLDVVDIGVAEVAFHDDASLEGEVEFDFDDLSLREGARLLFVAAGLVVHGQRAIALEDLQAVPFRRVVAGGKDQAVGRPQVRCGESHEPRRDVLWNQRDGDVVPGEDFRRGLRGLAREEATVEANENALLLHPPAGDLIGDGLRQAPDVVESEALADDGPPATRPKRNLVLLLVAAWSE